MLNIIIVINEHQYRISRNCRRLPIFFKICKYICFEANARYCLTSILNFDKKVARRRLRLCQLNFATLTH